MSDIDWVTPEDKRRKFVEDYHASLSPYVKDRAQLGLEWNKDSKLPNLYLDWYDQNIPQPILKHIYQLIKDL